MQQIITLTTDFGYKDYYVSVLKGKLYSNVNNCNVIDISHGVNDYHIEEAGFVLVSSYSHFPKGTIHIVSVSAFISVDTPVICMEYDGHYFIATDNGVLGVVVGNNHFTDLVRFEADPLMSVNDAFVYCAYQLSEGKLLKKIGRKMKSIHKLNTWADSLVVEDNKIIGKIIYEDTYGNLICNIPRNLFESVKNDRKFVIRVKDRSISKINKYFAEVKPSDNPMRYERAGDFVALFNDLNLLTLAIVFSKPNEPGGSPKSLINLRVSDTVSIEFTS